MLAFTVTSPRRRIGAVLTRAQHPGARLQGRKRWRRQARDHYRRIESSLLRIRDDMRSFSSEEPSNFWPRSISSVLCLLPVLLCSAMPTGLGAAPSPGFKLPPVDMTDPNRCKLSSSTIGQANAARDKFLDARFCDLRGQDFSGFDLSGVLLEGAIADEARFKSTQLSKAYAPHFTCRKCVFEDAVVDRVNFEDADLSGSVFKNAVLSDSIFNDGTVIRDADFTDVYIGEYGLRRLCKNPHLEGENPMTGAPTRASLGCRAKD